MCSVKSYCNFCDDVWQEEDTGDHWSPSEFIAKEYVWQEADDSDKSVEACMRKGIFVKVRRCPSYRDLTTCATG